MTGAGSRGRRIAAVMVTLALLVGGLFVAKRLHLWFYGYRHVSQALHRMQRSLHPVVVTDGDIWRELQGIVPVASDSLESYRQWRARQTRCTFPRPDRTLAAEIRRLKSTYPEVWSRLRWAADQYAQGIFRPFDGPPVRLGDDFTWTSFPPHQDELYLFELGALQHLPQLAEAYLGTGDELYLNTIRRQLTSFLRDNPIDNSVNWAEVMNVSRRLYSLIWTAALLEHDSAGRTLFPALVRAMYGHARFVAEHMDRPRPFNAHAIFGPMGLYFFTTAYPEFASSAAWRRIAESRLLVELRRQYTADGAQKEFSPTYQLALTDIYADYAASVRSCGGSFKRGVQDAIRRQARYLHLLQQPDGRVPLIRDSDDGLILRLVEQSYRQANTAVFLGYAATGAAPPVADAEALWTGRLVLGDSVARVVPGSTAVGAAPVTRSAQPSVRVAATAGVVRFDFDVWGGLVDFGSLGASPGYSGHSHAAFGNLILWKDNHSVAIDPGTYTYRRGTRSPGGVVWRDILRSSQAHSTAVVDDSSQANPSGEFGFNAWPKGELLFADLRSGVLIAGGAHEGYARVGAGRSFRLLIGTRDGLLVVDWFPAAHGRHRYAEHLTLEDSAAVRADGTVRLWNGMGYVAPAAGDSVVVLTGSIDPPAGWKSTSYGRLEPTPQLRSARWFDGVAAAALQICWPGETPRGPAPRPVMSKRAAGLVTVTFSLGARSFELLLVSQPDATTHLYRADDRVFDGIGALLVERGGPRAIPLGGSEVRFEPAR